MVQDQLTLNPLLFLSFFSFLFLTVFVYKYWLCTTQTTLKNLPPSPPKFPIIGNLHQLSIDTHISLQSLAKKHGPILMLLHFGSVPVLVVSSADAAREIMKTHDLVFSDRPRSRSTDVIFYNGKDVGFAQYNEHWRQLRSMCLVQLLSNRRVHSFHNVRDEEVTLLIQNIKDSKSTTLNLSELFNTVTNNIIFKIVLGKKYSISSEGSNSFQNLFAELSVLIGKFSVGDYIPWLYWIDILNGLRGKVERSAKKIDDFLEDVIRDHIIALANGTAAANQDFVSILLEFQKHNTNDSGFTIDKVSIKAVIMDMIFAGTDTTHVTLDWTMAELIKNPKIMTKLQNEVREIGRGKSRISENDLEKMHYLKAVMKESMRIKIPGPLLLPREAREDAKVMGYDIKKGTQVLINAWAIARDPSLWDNPEEFRPERFLNSGIDYKGLHFEYLPFGGGRRGCPGIQFATVVNELVLANVVHIFDFALADGKRMEDLDMAGVPGLTIRRKYPLLVIATPHDI